MVLPDSFRCLSRGCCSAAPHRFHFGRRPGELSVISFICYYKLHVQSGSGFSRCSMGIKWEKNEIKKPRRRIA